MTENSVGPVVRGASGEWMWDRGGAKGLMAGSCHHRSDGACGGCYARAVETLGRLAKAGNVLAMDFEEQCRAESPTMRAAYTPEQQREFTAAVVPQKRSSP